MHFLSRLLQCQCLPFCWLSILFILYFPCMALCFCSFTNCTFDSKFRHLACQVSFSICSSRNFYSTFFKHFLTNSISSLCLTNVVVNASSWSWTGAFFISSTIHVSVPSTIMKFYYRAFRVSFASSSSWVFSNFSWISWSFWSSCLWVNTSLTLIFSHSCLWASNSKGSFWCLTCFHLYSNTPCKCSSSKESYQILFP